MRKIVRHRMRKRGLPAGSLVSGHEGHEGSHKPFIAYLDYNQETLRLESVDEIGQLAPIAQGATCTWIDINGAHEVEAMEQLGKIFGLHSLTLEDILNTDQRPKMEEFDDYIYFVFQKPIYRKEEGRLDVEQVSLILTPQVVVSLSERVQRTSAPIYTRMLREKNRIRRLGTDYLAYVLVDWIVDEYFVAMERCEEKIERLEKELAARPEASTMQEIHQMKQDMIVLRKSMWPLREVIGQLATSDSPLFDEEIKIYLKDLRDHIMQVIEVIEVYRDMLSGMLDIYLSTMSNKTNEIMKTLTMIASLFIPLTLITGIYGMNFKDMPELGWVWGYPFALGLMALVGLSMLLYFKRKGWI